jgi:hypothetical protein
MRDPEMLFEVSESGDEMEPSSVLQRAISEQALRGSGWHTDRG